MLTVVLCWVAFSFGWVFGAWWLGGSTMRKWQEVDATLRYLARREAELAAEAARLGRLRQRLRMAADPNLSDILSDEEDAALKRSIFGREA